jgi:transposase
LGRGISVPHKVEICCKWLVALVKSENPWYYECSKSTPQQALIALREAWKRCFNKTAGVPKFKKSFSIDRDINAAINLSQYVSAPFGGESLWTGGCRHHQYEAGIKHQATYE